MNKMKKEKADEIIAAIRTIIALGKANGLKGERLLKFIEDEISKDVYYILRVEMGA